MTLALVAATHLIGLGLGFAGLVVRQLALNELDRQKLERLFLGDNIAGIGALLYLSAGLYRLFGELDKPLAYYTGSTAFQVKMGLLALIFVLETWPMVTFVRWRMQVARGEEPDLSPSRIFRVLNGLEIALLPVMVVMATMMARGLFY